jgi:hypothetical protein
MKEKVEETRMTEIIVAGTEALLVALSLFLSIFVLMCFDVTKFEMSFLVYYLILP